MRHWSRAERENASTFCAAWPGARPQEHPSGTRWRTLPAPHTGAQFNTSVWFLLAEAGRKEMR